MTPGNPTRQRLRSTRTTSSRDHTEDPKRFARSRSVGAHMGLTPRQYQSGEIDRSGRISRCGDTLARTLMYEAAVVILTRVKRASNLKDWAQAIAKRSGPRQSACGAGQKAVRDPAQYLALGRGLSLVRTTSCRLSNLTRSTRASARGRVAHGARVQDDCEGGRWAAWFPCEPVVDIAAPVLRTRCCGGPFRPRREP